MADRLAIGHSSFLESPIQYHLNHLLPSAAGLHIRLPKRAGAVWLYQRKSTMAITGNDRGSCVAQPGAGLEPDGVESPLFEFHEPSLQIVIRGRTL